MRILLTGFEPFGGLAVNPSQIIVDNLAAPRETSSRAEITARILPTEFEAAGMKIRRLIRDVKPQVIFGLGVAPTRIQSVWNASL